MERRFFTKGLHNAILDRQRHVHNTKAYRLLEWRTHQRTGSSIIVVYSQVSESLLASVLSQC